MSKELVITAQEYGHFVYSTRTWALLVFVLGLKIKITEMNNGNIIQHATNLEYI